MNCRERSYSVNVIYVICSMTSSGFVSPPVQNISHNPSIMFLSSPVIIVYSLSGFHIYFAYRPPLTLEMRPSFFRSLRVFSTVATLISGHNSTIVAFVMGPIWFRIISFTRPVLLYVLFVSNSTLLVKSLYAATITPSIYLTNG